MKELLLALVALTLLACGSQSSASGEASGDDTSSGSADTREPGSEPRAATSASCGGLSPGDACTTDENLAQCREMEARCPGQVMVRESCPVQFACP